MNDYPSKVKEKLNSIIKDMADHHWLFTNNPGRDFSRQHLGKLSFYDTGVTPVYGDKLICLSTCEYTLDNGRLVVAAVRIT